MTNKRVDNKNCAVFLGECCNKDDTGCGNCMESSQMTNNQLTDDGLSLLISKLDKALSECINHGFTDSAEEYADMINALRELQECRKAEKEAIGWAAEQRAGIAMMIGDREDDGRYKWNKEGNKS